MHASSTIRILTGLPIADIIMKRYPICALDQPEVVFNMKIINLTIIFLVFLSACNSNQPQQVVTGEPYPNDTVLTEPAGDEYWAKDNFDLQRVGDLLERSDDPGEFERYLNDDDGLNNLDLNGDSYADYISVREFDDRDSNSRGLSLFSRFGPDLIQEIATIFFYRDEPRYPGSRILLTGNEQIYGDNYYYETNWLDRSLPLASFLFSDRNDYYRSPYYYDNYPDWYEPYAVVDTPVYRTRIVDLYPQPVFVYTNAAPVYFSKIKIKSPNNGLHLGHIKARLMKPTKEQAEFFKNNPRGPKGKFDSQVGKQGDKPGRDDPPRSDRGDLRGNPEKGERGAERGNPDKPAGGQPDKQPGGPPKVDNPNKGGGNPDKGGGNPNKGGGNPNKGGGGGKGGGKKP